MFLKKTLACHVLSFCVKTQPGLCYRLKISNHASKNFFVIFFYLRTEASFQSNKKDETFFTSSCIFSIEKRSIIQFSYMKLYDEHYFD